MRPARRLVLTWAEPADGADRSRHTRVAIDVEKVDDMVRLTVTHDKFKPASDMLKTSNGCRACFQLEVLSGNRTAAEDLGIAQAGIRSL